MTVRIGDTVPANRRRDEERPAAATETRRRMLPRSLLRRHRLASQSHLDGAPHQSRT